MIKKNSMNKFWKDFEKISVRKLVWRLVELLLQKEKDLNQVALDQAKQDNKPNDHRQNEV